MVRLKVKEKHFKLYMLFVRPHTFSHIALVIERPRGHALRTSTPDRSRRVYSSFKSFTEFRTLQNRNDSIRLHERSGRMQNMNDRTEYRSGLV